jgi:threonine/homoserine/homoserine lactone efflux protein
MIAAAFVVGIVVAMPPGPVMISTGQKAVVGGFWHAFTFNVGSLLADTLYALMVYFGLAALIADNPLIRLVLWKLGGCCMIYIGVESIRSRAKSHTPNDAILVEKHWHNFRSGLFMTLLNPLAVVSWIAIGGNFFTAWPSNWPPMESFGLIAMLVMLLGGMAWALSVAWVFSSVRRLVGPRLLKGIFVASGLFLIAYGLSAWWAAVGMVL